MQDVRVDADGDFRCWNCGGKNFDHKRTTRAKVMVGVAALATKKKLKCQRCGEYNQTGNAKTYTGPASKKYRRQEEIYGKPPSSAAPAPSPAADSPPDGAPNRTFAEIMRERKAQGPAVPPPPAGPPEGWYPDPKGEASERWWDGSTWTGATR